MESPERGGSGFGTAMRVLVADDEDVIRSVISQVLSEDGHEVIEAASGEEALEAFRAEPFPLVLADIYMGKMNGIELLEQIKVVEPRCLVVIMTSNASLDTATTALRTGAYDYLNKPFEDIDLISAVVNRAAEKLSAITEKESLMKRLKKNTEELETVNRELKTLAESDGLTGLFNHRYFREALDSVLSVCHDGNMECSLLFSDIDHFKQYNDSMGHPAGDALLKTLSGLLRGQSRKDDVIARYGGEEFVMLLPGTGKEEAGDCAERIRLAVAEHSFPGEGQQPLGRVSLSLGVATFPSDAGNAGALIDRADRALYHAKNEGRNRTCAWQGDSLQTVGAGMAVRKR